MKKIVRELSSAEVLVDKLTNKSIVGIKWGHLGEKTWVVKSKIGYFAVPVGMVDLSSCWTKPTLKAFVEVVIDDMGVDVVLFDSEAELIQWLKN